MQVHSNSTTTPVVRKKIREGSGSCRASARQHGVSPTTASRWKKRDSVRDRSSRPRKVRQALCPDCRKIALELRKQGLTLDECLEALRQLFPETSRSTLYRLFGSEGLGRLAPKRQRSHGKFKDYKPGFVHADHFQIPAIGAKKRYCFLAIDRATRISFIRTYDSKCKQSSSDFIERAFEFFPFKIYMLLTDNGPEFTNRFYKRAPGGALVLHPLDQLCQRLGVSRRFTRPYTPKTNGMAERLVGLCKTATVSSHRYRSHEELEAHILEWARFYNLQRKHGGIGRIPPIQMAERWYKMEPALFKRDPALLRKASSTY